MRYTYEVHAVRYTPVRFTPMIIRLVKLLGEICGISEPTPPRLGYLW